LLAYFVVNRGRPCSTDRIVDALWGESAPLGAFGTVQTYVSQLRKLLADDAQLLTGPAGYTFAIAPGSLDADRFEQLVKHAGEVTDPDERLRLLDEALALRRGPALDEFAGAPWADEAARHWDRSWILAVEQRVDALLELDCPRDAIADLEHAIGADPVHERSWALLATAHHRSGDQSRALAACRDARKVLAQELGVEPGPELQAVERMILDHDETLHFGGNREGPRLRASLPSGVVTFLITDIDKSTRLWENDAASMAVALDRHDDIIGAAIAQHGGTVFKHLGDGVLAAFSTPTHAVAAAIDAQRCFSIERWPTEEPVRSRMAIHTGEAVVERDGDYFGPVLNRCSRLVTLGHGGQILVTGIVADALRDKPLPEVHVESLGEQRLRDFAEPERVAHVWQEATPPSFPPLRSIELVGNLPALLTTFVGREDELKQLIEDVPAQRLTSLVGPGGIGKTRLAVEVASELQGRFGAGTWFVDLSAISDDALVPSAVASTFGLAQGSEGDLVESLEQRLGGRDALLVLDNCEQVIDGAAHLVQRLLQVARELFVLVTSRQPLELAGEVVFRLGPLATDAVADARSAAEVLFIERAKTAEPRFDVDGGNAAAVRELCVRLDGVPLALELAAARVRSLQPVDLLARLDDRFRLLRGSRRDESDRHQTMRAAVAWSYDLLTPPQQHLFNNLSVCRGGFDLSAVEVLGADVQGDAIDIVDDLVNRSLVIPVATETGTRFRMLETLREFGADRLDASGERDDIEERHAQHYVALARRSDAVVLLEHDLDNASAAVGWFVANEPPSAVRHLDSLWPHFAARYRLLEMQRWLETLVEADLDDALETRVLVRLGDTCFQTGVRLEDAITWLERALEIHEARGENVLAASVRVRLARNLSGYPQSMDIERALQHLTAAEPVLVELGDERRLGDLHLMRASTALYALRPDVGLEAARSAARFAERQGLEGLRLHALSQVGVHLGHHGDVEEAFTLMEEVWDDADVAGEPFACFLAAWSRGFGALLLGDPGDCIVWMGRERRRPHSSLSPLQARTLDAQLAYAHLRMGDVRPALAIPAHEIVNTPQVPPLLATMSGDWNRALRLYEVGRAECERHGNRAQWMELSLALAELQARVGDDEAAHATASDALAVMIEAPCPYFEIPLRALLARLGGDVTRHIASCRTIMHDHEYRALAAPVALAEAQTLAVSGDADGASDAFARALACYRRYGLKLEEAETLARWSRALEEYGDVDGSAERQAECVDVLEKMGATSWRCVLIDGAI
jgi:predicted ATPase/class 3 adenylate cyclase